MKLQQQAVDTTENLSAGCETGLNPHGSSFTMFRKGITKKGSGLFSGAFGAEFC
jgi:hypothetical protein